MQEKACYDVGITGQVWLKMIGEVQTMSFFNKMFEKKPKVNKDFEYAKELHGKGKWLEAVVAYKQALKREPTRADIYIEISVCLGQAGNFDEAQECLDKAEQLDPTLAPKIESSRDNFRIRKTVKYYASVKRAADVKPLLDLIRVRESAAVQHAVGNLMFDQGYLAKLLWNFELEPSALDQVLAGLKDEHHEIRYVCIAKIGVMKYEPGIDLIIAGLEDSHVWVRTSAALSLGDMKITKAIPALQKMASSDTEEKARTQARIALGKLGATVSP